MTRLKRDKELIPKADFRVNINHITNLKAFLRAWDHPDDPFNSVEARFKTGSMGNINMSGEPRDICGPIVSKWQPNFIATIEPGVRELVSILINEFDLVTYSSCEGHNYPLSSLAQPTRRRVGILPRTEEEFEEIKVVFDLAAHKTNARMRQHAVIVLAKQRVLTTEADARRCLSIIFDLSQGSNYSQYFLDIDAVYFAFLEELTRQRKGSAA
jgi:hypothetical protein